MSTKTPTKREAYATRMKLLLANSMPRLTSLKQRLRKPRRIARASPGFGASQMDWALQRRHHDVRGVVTPGGTSPSTTCPAASGVSTLRKP